MCRAASAPYPERSRPHSARSGATMARTARASSRRGALHRLGSAAWLSAAELYGFRVFPSVTTANPKPRASNFAIAKAIDRAVAAGCDLLNLSLGGGGSDPATETAIEDAYNAGAVVIAATGNDDRQPVSFPASFDLCVAVSAAGRKGLFPSGTVFDGDVAAPYGTDKKNFVAAFSNIGNDVDCIGPGVAVVSTVPAATYAAMSGTSMGDAGRDRFGRAHVGEKQGTVERASGSSARQLHRQGVARSSQESWIRVQVRGPGSADLKGYAPRAHAKLNGVRRFIVRYRGKGEYPQRVLDKMRGVGISIIEDSGRMLLVEAPKQTLEEALASEPEWLVTPEVSYERPNPRPSIK